MSERPTIVAFDRNGLATDDPRKAWWIEWVSPAGNSYYCRHLEDERLFGTNIRRAWRSFQRIRTVRRMP